MNSEALTKENISVLLKKISTPVSVGLFFQTMYNVIDTFYASLISTEAVAAISLGFIFVYILVGIGNGLSSTLTALIGNCLGAKKSFLARIYIYKGLLFIPLAGIVFSVIGYYVAPWLFQFLGATGSYLRLSLEYINIIILGNVFFMINLACNAVLNAKGDTLSFRNTLIFGFIANIVLNPIFMYGFWFIPALGLTGISLATILIQVIIMFYLIRRLFLFNIIHANQFRYATPDGRIYKKLLEQGIPSSLNIVIMGIGAIILMYFISSYGQKAVAAYGIAFRIETILLMPALGLSTSVLIMISNNFGARKYERVMETLNLALKYGLIICSFSAVMIHLFGELLIELFESDEEVVLFATTYFIYQIWVFFALLILYICVSVLQGIKQPQMVFYIGLYRQVIAQTLIAFLVVKYFEMDVSYLWLGILLMVYSAAIFIYIYTKKALPKHDNTRTTPVKKVIF